MAQILIPTPLRKFTDNQSKLTFEGDRVIDVLKNLTSKYPSISPYLLDDDQIKPYIKLFKGDDDIDGLQKGETKIGDQETLSIVPAIAGGNIEA